MKRLIEEDSGTCLIFAIDHGLTSPKYFPELDITEEKTKEVIKGGAHVIMLNMGFAQKVVGVFTSKTSLALMVNSSAPRSPEAPIVTPISTVEAALRLGADAVVVFSALQSKNDAQMINFLAKTGDDCDRLGMPFIAEAEYPTTYESLTNLSDQYGVDYLFYNTRVCAELGADIIKINWTGDRKSWEKIVKAAHVPVVLAGGSKLDDFELLKRFEHAIASGAIGCSVGRNIFQHKSPFAITKALSRVIKEKWEAERAYEELKDYINENKL
jgi:DhnA family fructose-bisphosphate aldolase class Ia